MSGLSEESIKQDDSERPEELAKDSVTNEDASKQGDQAPQSQEKQSAPGESSPKEDELKKDDQKAARQVEAAEEDSSQAATAIAVGSSADDEASNKSHPEEQPQPQIQPQSHQQPQGSTPPSHQDGESSDSVAVTVEGSSPVVPETARTDSSKSLSEWEDVGDIPLVTACKPKPDRREIVESMLLKRQSGAIRLDKRWLDLGDSDDNEDPNATRAIEEEIVFEKEAGGGEGEMEEESGTGDDDEVDFASNDAIDLDSDDLLTLDDATRDQGEKVEEKQEEDDDEEESVDEERFIEDVVDEIAGEDATRVRRGRDPDFDIEDPSANSHKSPPLGGEGATGKGNDGSLTIGIILWLITASLVAIVAVNLIDDSDTGTPSSKPSSTTGTATTPLSPVQSDCDFTGVTQPHIIDQCNCFGEIRILADDIGERYRRHKERFVPTVYLGFEEAPSSCTTRNQALMWLASDNDYVFNDEERRQRFALATMFVSLNGGTWKDRFNWLSPSRSCDWVGVECDNKNVVTSIAIDSNLVRGHLPREVVLLNGLSLLSLANNEIGGTVPPELFSLPELRSLDLQSNKLTGSIPLDIGETTSLEKFNIDNNRLIGSLPIEFGDAIALTSLQVGNNLFTGKLPLSLFDLPLLQVLHVHENQLTGTMPIEISRASQLKSLALGPNLFTGFLQESISELPNLEYLSIRGVDIGGPLLDSYGQKLSNLVELVVSNTVISGTIPTVFGRLSRLQKLDLSSNNLQDKIPTELGNLQRLRSLHLQNNTFTGAIPNVLGNILTLTELQLHDNQLTGSVPIVFADLTALGTLSPSNPNLAHDRMSLVSIQLTTSRILTKKFDLKEILRLDGNNLRSRVSQGICALRNGVLEEFIVDCPIRQVDDFIGVVCGVPTCCSDCRVEASV